MSDWRKDAKKICAHCRTEFKPLGNVSKSEWRKRRHCSPQCGADARWAALRAAKTGACAVSYSGGGGGSGGLGTTFSYGAGGIGAGAGDAGGSAYGSNGRPEFPAPPSGLVRAPLPDWALLRFPRPCRPRKRHECRLCGTWVLPGEDCVRWTDLERGDGWWTCHMHPECYVATKEWDDGDWEFISPGDEDRPAVRMYWPKTGKEGSHDHS
jgi:hypothetical protein